MRRGQVAVFLVVCVCLLLVLTGFYVFMEFRGQDGFVLEDNSVQKLAQWCAGESLEKGVTYVSITGGMLQSDGIITEMGSIPYGDEVEYSKVLESVKSATDYDLYFCLDEQFYNSGLIGNSSKYTSSYFMNDNGVSMRASFFFETETSYELIEIESEFAYPMVEAIQLANAGVNQEIIHSDSTSFDFVQAPYLEDAIVYALSHDTGVVFNFAQKLEPGCGLYFEPVYVYSLPHHYEFPNRGDAYYSEDERVSIFQNVMVIDDLGGSNSTKIKIEGDGGCGYVQVHRV